MDNKTIQLNQIITDTKMLREDMEAGLYKENNEGFQKEVKRIGGMMDEVEGKIPELIQSPKDEVGAYQD